MTDRDTTSATPVTPQLTCVRDGDLWIVAHPLTGIHGCGYSPLDALGDYDQAVIEHADVERRLNEGKQ